jgi:hypothetical protein
MHSSDLLILVFFFFLDKKETKNQGCIFWAYLNNYRKFMLQAIEPLVYFFCNDQRWAISPIACATRLSLHEFPSQANYRRPKNKAIPSSHKYFLIISINIIGSIMPYFFIKKEVFIFKKIS